MLRRESAIVKEIGGETNKRIQELCKKISVAHDLDAEIQEELYSHMEDKLLAYLNGEEALGEEDAFILVREHFGDPSALKGLLQDVHAFEAHVSLARRLAAAMIVSAGVLVTYLYLTFAAFRFWPALHGNGGDHVFIAAMIPAYFVFPWLLLRHWQRRLDAGHSPWFLTWHPACLLGAVAVLFALQSLMMSGLPYTQGGIESSPVGWIFGSVLLALPVLQCMVWLWWCDRPPRKVRAVGYAAGVWAVWVWSSSSVAPIQSVVYSGKTSLLRAIAENLAATFFIVVIYAFVACALYAMARRAAAGFKRRPAESQ